VSHSLAERPVVLVDMDGVLADFDQELIERLHARHPAVPRIITRANFYVSDDYAEHADLVRSISNEAGFFDSLPMIEGALEGWQRILESGYHPRICSSPIRTNPYSKSEKLGWLEQHFAPVFGRLVVDEAIITSHKEEHSGIALVDDRPELANADRAPWQHIVFDTPYNRHVQQPRLYGWRDSNLLQLLQAAEIQFDQR
jgi:5'-nucleotidase